MSRQARVRMTVIAIILLALFCVGFGAYYLVLASTYMSSITKIGALVIIGGGFALLFTIPSSIRAAHRKADMEEMLDEYQKRKHRP